MRLAANSSPSPQMPLQGVPARPGAHSPTGEGAGQGGARERVSIDLRGLGPRLKVYASARGRTPAAAVRLALVQALDAESAGDRLDVGVAPVSSGAIKVTLRVSADHAARLAQRARSAEMSQGAYVSALLDGDCPAPLPENHDGAIQALTGSTDHLAVLSTDLNAFVRLFGHLPNSELQRYRASVVSVAEDVQKHLALASALIAEVRAARRGRR